MLTAYIAMGANLPSPAGPPEATLAAAAIELAKIGCLTHYSSLYRTEPVGFHEQPAFINAVVALKIPRQPLPDVMAAATGSFSPYAQLPFSTAPHTLIEKLLDIERAFGRNRTTSFLNGPRTLDLDLLLIDDLVLSTSELELPHPRLAERAFVLIPLSEIAPHLRHPLRNQTIAELLNRLPVSEHAAVRIESTHWPPPCATNDDTRACG